MRLPSSLAVLVAGLAQAQAQYLINELSFGFGDRINPQGGNSIPNFSMQGRPGVPELLSNKVILTPVAPGNQRGAVWSDRTLQQQTWIADVEFRANGPERGGGNFNIWLVRDGSHVVGSNSIYTAGRFEGLALVIDQHSGSGGMLRGFLNDGQTDYASHPNVDSLAFSNCRFSYRNLGRPTQIKLRQTESKFSVDVAGRPCFESDKIRLPSGYNFGVSAVSAENPDSFEVFKLVVLTGDTSNQNAGNNNNNNNNNNNPAGNVNQGSGSAQGRSQTPVGRSAQGAVDDPYDNAIPDVDADKITSSKAQFADLHNRLQSVNHHLSTIFRTIAQNAGVSEQRHAETSAVLGEVKALLSGSGSGGVNIGLSVSRVADKVDVLERRLGDVEREVRALRAELSARLRDSENAIKYHVSDKHEALSGHVEAHAKHGYTRFLLVVVAFQASLAAAYMWYKRRKVSPKKYL
ncbi:hypothetical protein VTK26DRAFT_1370 [Humicola hyalothermophila]